MNFELEGLEEIEGRSSNHEGNQIMDNEHRPKVHRTAIGLSRQTGVETKVEQVAHAIIGCAIEVHRALGPGLLEKLYEEALVYELDVAGLRVSAQREIVVQYKSIQLRGQRLDLIVEESVIVEIKSIAQFADIHKAQLLSYVRAANVPLGLLLNFNVPILKDGLRRIVNDRLRPLNPTPPSPLSSTNSSSSIPSSPSSSQITSES